MRKILMAAVAAMALALTGCGFYTVPPAAKGKILSTSGYSADVKETGKYLLWGRDQMVVLDTSTQVATESLAVKMRDDMTLNFQVRFRTRIHGSDSVINAMFNDISHENYQVTLPMVYRVYGKDVVQNAARSVVGKYRVNEVASNFDKINADLQTELRKAMASSPLEVSNVTIGNIEYPALITEAINAQQERELAIETEANEQAVRLVKKTNELKLAQEDYEIRMTKAKAIRDENQITAQGMNPMLLEYRRLEVLEKMADNKNNVIVPVEGLVNPAMQLKLLGK